MRRGAPRGEKVGLYPLVNCHITMENHHFLWDNSLFLWQFSIAMLVYQRVTSLSKDASLMYLL